MSEFNVTKTDLFERMVNKLSKKYRNLENDIDDFLSKVSVIDNLGISLGHHLYKARIRNSDIGKGKSGGYRLITYLKVFEKQITLIYIYSKSDLKNISEKKLDEIILKSFLE